MNTDSCINSIDLTPLNLPLTESFSIATGAQDEVRNVLIEVRLKNGIVGLGEAAPFPAVSGETQESSMQAIQSVQQNLIGADIRNWKTIFEKLVHPLHHHAAALCGLQMALLDALCKTYNIPVAVLFGGAGNTLITDMTVTASDVAHASASAKGITARGINTIKIKTSGKDIQLDFDRIKSVKTAAPHALISLDGNCGYTLDGAMQLVEMMKREKIKILFFEQPLPRESWREQAIFAKESGVKVAADESARSAADIIRIVEERSAHVINIKLMKSGILEANRMVEIAKTAGLELMIGGMVETILAMSFSAHFAAGSGGFRYADLDTPMFIPAHPFTGGFKLSGETITIDLNQPGHGVNLKNPE